MKRAVSFLCCRRRYQYDLQRARKVIRHDSKSFSAADKVSKPVIRKGAKSRRCKVLYSYTPAHEDELELKVDEVIDFMEEIEEGWWKGQLRGKIGVFPSNFVENLEDTGGGPAEDEKKDPGKEDRKVAKLSMSRLPDSRSLPRLVGGGDPPDDKPNLTAAPAKFSKKVPAVLDEVDIGAPKLPPKPAERMQDIRNFPVKEQARVLFAYEALNDDELQLKEGDIITVIAKDIEDKGWWKGELNGKVGVFPDNFVALIPIEEVKPKKPEMLPDKTTPSFTRPQSTKADFSKKSPSPDLPPPATKKEVAAKKSTPIPIPANKKIGPVTAAVRDFHRRDPTTALRFTNSAYLEHNGAHSSDASGESMALDFDSIERNEMLTHPTASRAKAPKRRPPSSVYPRDMEPGGVMNGNAELENGDVHHLKLDEDRHDGESEKEKRLPPAPWMEELKMNQARRTKELSPGKEERFSEVFAKSDSVEADRRSAPPLPSKPATKSEEEAPEVPQRKLGWNKQPKQGLRNSALPEKAEALPSKPKPVPTAGKPKVTTPTTTTPHPPPVTIPTESAPSEEELRKQVKVLKEGHDRLQAQVLVMQEELEKQQKEFALRLAALGEELRMEQKLRLSLEEKLDHLSSVV